MSFGNFSSHNSKAFFVTFLAGFVLISAFANASSTFNVCKSGCDYTSIQAALDASSDGDIIEVDKGTYDRISEGREINAQGLINIYKQVTIRAKEGTTPIVDGSEVDGVFKIHANAMTGGQVIIEGFEITGDSTTDIAITALVCSNENPADIIIRSNYIHGVAGGFDIWGWSGCSVSSSKVVKSIKIEGNTFSDLGTDGSVQGIGVMLEDLSNSGKVDGTTFSAVVNNNNFDDIHSASGSDYGVGIAVPRANEENNEAVNAKINENNFNNVYIGIEITDGDVSSTKIQNNNFDLEGLCVFTSGITNGPVNAEQNWWGIPTPDFTTVISGNVDYRPWCTDSTCSSIDEDLPSITSMAISMDGSSVAGTISTEYYLMTDEEHVYPNQHVLTATVATTSVSLVPTGEEKSFGFYLQSYTNNSYDAYLHGKLDSISSEWVAESLNGVTPFIYLDVSDTGDSESFFLEDGFMKDVMSNPNQNLKIDGDYPEGTYVYQGTIESEWGIQNTITVTMVVDGTSPELYIAGFDADDSSMTYSEGYILNTLNTEINHKVQFTSGSEALENLRSEAVGLYLHPTEGQATVLQSYYSLKPEPYRTYLNGAAAGTNPFAYIKTEGTAIELMDGAQYNLSLGSVQTDMVIPDDYPLGTYTVSGQIHDIAGNPTTVTFTLIVAGDRTAPTITLIGDNPMEISYRGTYTELGATVSDDHDTGLSATISGVVDTSNVGNYYVYYNAVDNSGNAATEVIRTVSVVPVALTPSITALDKTYDGTKLASASCTLEGVIGGDNVTCSITGATFSDENAESEKVVTASISLSGADSTNYILTSAEATTTADIIDKEISVSANEQTKIYGEDDPTLTYTNDALIGSDEFSGNLERESGETVGSYSINQGTLDAGNNYAITFTGSSLEITKKSASIIPDASSKTYGEADPSFTGTLDGFLEADGIIVSYTRTSGEDTGDYIISATLEPIDKLNNYDVTYETAKFTINKASQIIIFNELSNKTYGDADFTISAESNLSTVTFAPSGVCTMTGSTVHISGTGMCNITASQIGNVNFNAAADVSRWFYVNPASQVSANQTDVKLPVNNTEAVNLTIPNGINNATMTLDGVVNSTNTTNATLSAPITVNTSIATIMIPSGITITGDSSWNGTINLPQIVSTTVSALGMPNNGSVAAVIEVGFGNTQLTFDKAVKIIIPNGAGKLAGYSRNGIFTRIDNVCPSNETDIDSIMDAYGYMDCKRSSGTDMIIWTKHFTQFVSYTESAPSSTGTTTTTSTSSTSGGVAPAPKIEITGQTAISQVADTYISYSVSVTNKDTKSDTYTLTIDGLPENWYKISEPVTIAAKATKTMTYALDLPENATDSSFTIKVTSGSGYEASYDVSLKVVAKASEASQQNGPISSITGQAIRILEDTAATPYVQYTAVAIVGILIVILGIRRIANQRKPWNTAARTGVPMKLKVQVQKAIREDE